jgi:DNA replication and repair protein RecF
MKIKNIKLENYRNIKNMEVAFDNVNIIWGKNAQGKTNLIEAIYLFTGSKSFRGAKDSQLINFSKESCKIAIEFESSNREQTAEIQIANRKTAMLNGIKKKSTAELGDEIKAVVFSPVHLSMIKDGPGERRKFVDSALCQLKSNYRTLLKDYNRLLFQRSIILKSDIKNDSVFDIYTENVAHFGAKIIYQRLKYIEAITPFVKEIYSGISAGAEEIDIKYTGNYELTDSVEQIEQKLLNELELTKKIDIHNKSTSCGPHRDDIEILINSNSARDYGSQGQQRSCVLALKLAEASLLKQMTNIEPIALLDDVMSELDERRQDYILNHIKDWQVFITCCDKETILRLKQGKTFHIENGKII